MDGGPHWPGQSCITNIPHVVFVCGVHTLCLQKFYMCDTYALQTMAVFDIV